MWRRKPSPSSSRASSPPASPERPRRANERAHACVSTPRAGGLEGARSRGCRRGAPRPRAIAATSRARRHPRAKRVAQRRAHGARSRSRSGRACERASWRGVEALRRGLDGDAPRGRAGSTAFSARWSSRARERVSTRTSATCPSACTPASVRPAPVHLAPRRRTTRAQRRLERALHRALALRLHLPAREVRCRRTRAPAGEQRASELRLGPRRLSGAEAGFGDAHGVAAARRTGSAAIQSSEAARATLGSRRSARRRAPPRAADGVAGRSGRAASGSQSSTPAPSAAARARRLGLERRLASRARALAPSPRRSGRARA